MDIVLKVFLYTPLVVSSAVFLFQITRPNSGHGWN